MNSSLVLVTCAFGMSLALAGCGPRASVPPKPLAAANPQISPAPENVAPAKEPVEKDPPTEEPEASEASEGDSTPGEIKPPESLERLLLSTPGGPLIIEVSLTVDGRPFDSALSQLAEQARAAADTDGDGRSTWKEVLASPKFKFGQFGNNPITADMTLKMLTEMYDANRDGLVNAGEVPKFLTKNMGGPSAFSLRATNQNRGDNVIESALRRWLDEDEDGKLSAAEIAAAPTRLRARDADDDDLLTPADFVAPAANLNPGEMQRPQSRRFGPEAAHLLGPKAKWNSVLVALEDLYGADGSSAAGFALSPDLFKQLDSDENFSLDRKEVVALNTLEPHLKLSADFSRLAGDKQSVVKLKLVSLAPRIAEHVKIVAQDDSRLALALMGTSLEFYCLDAAPIADYEAQAQAALAMYDADKNGYIEKKELPEVNEGLLGPFDSIDADGDGKVYPADIVGQLARQQAALLGQIQARAGDNEDALFAALDLDADGRLSSREISAASERLTALDANADGELTVDEVPGSLAVGLVRGDAQAERAGLVAPPPRVRPRPADVPAWFARMDANEDGEISPREFLGALEKFRSLDANGDGFLSPAEVKAE